MAAENSKIRVLVSGPTASGKSTLAYAVAERLRQLGAVVEVADGEGEQVHVGRVGETVRGRILSGRSVSVTVTCEADVRDAACGGGSR